MLAYSFYKNDSRMMQYANALAQRGDTVDVIALGRSGEPKYEVIDGVNVYRIQRRKVNERGRLSYLVRVMRFLLLSIFIVGRRHLARRYQFIHVHSVPDLLVFATLVPKALGVRVVLDIHDILPEFYASKFGITPTSLQFKLLKIAERSSAGFADHVIVANHLWRARLIERGVPAHKCTAIRNYPDQRIFYRRPQKPETRKFVILYPGSLNAHQGVDIALKAFGRIANQIPEAEFQIYGEGPTLPDLRVLSDRLQLDGRVHFHEFLPIKQIAEVMAGADLAVVPKRASSQFGNEAASTKIMEFMALGVPVIVSRTKVDSYYFNDSMVRFFNSDNDAELAESILALYGNESLRRSLAANASRYTDQNNWRIAKQEYLELVDALVARKSPSPHQEATIRPFGS